MHFPTDRIVSRTGLPSFPVFEEGMVILVDKPLEWTSFDVVNKIRFAISYALGIKKIKVGHAGTLDPLATGLLLICTGKYTKQIDLLQACSKTYSGTFYLGATTPSYDAESEPDQEFGIGHITDELIAKAVVQLTGDIMQVPPAYSAIKIGGKTAYKLARRGKELELEARPVTISEFAVERKSAHEFTFMAHCSKGTYVRSLIHDLGKALGSGAYLTSLRREAIDIFQASDSHTIGSITEYIKAYAGLYRQNV